MESYNKALRDKKELDKKLKLYSREYKASVSNIDMERANIEGGLLDVQSKTKSLTDTVNAITNQLKDERKKVEEELKKVRELKNHPQTTRKGNEAAIRAELTKREEDLQKRIEVCNTKLELATGQKQLPDVNKAVGVLSILSKKEGFGAILSNIRQNKADQSKLPVMRPKTPKPDFDSPRNVSDLIAEFHKLPKLYPKKPTKQKPKFTTVLVEQYEARKIQRELAMNYGTRVRIKRAQHHCDSLTGLYIPTEASQKVLHRRTSLITLPKEVNAQKPMRRSLTH